MAAFIRFKTEQRTAVAKRKLWLDRDGAAAIEFGMLAGILMLLICFWAEIGVTLFMQAQLDGAVRREARLIRTGAVADGPTFTAKLCADVAALMRCSGIQVNVASAASFAALSSAVPTDGAGHMTNTGFAPGGAGADVIVQVGYARALFFPALGAMLGQGGAALIVSSIAFQNEPG